MSATHAVPTDTDTDTQIPPTPGEIPPTPGVPGWFPDERHSQAKQEAEDGGQGQEGGGLVETAKSYLPGEEDVQRALTNAGQAAKGWLPTSVAAYFPSSEVVIGTGRATRGGSWVRVYCSINGDGLRFAYGYPLTRPQSAGSRTRAHGSGPGREPSTSTSDPSVASEPNTTSAPSTLADAGSLDSTASTTTLSTQSRPTGDSDTDNTSTTVPTSGSDSPHPVPPLALGVNESQFIEALPSPPISIPMSESPVLGSFNTPDPSSLATTATGTIAQTGSAALNSSRPGDSFPSDTPQSFIDPASSLQPTPGPPPPPPPKDLDTSDSTHLNQGGAPPVPTKDSNAPPMKDSVPSTPDSHSQSSDSESEAEEDGNNEDDKEEGASGERGGKKKKKGKKGKLLQRLKEKLHVGHSHESEAS
ncbi:hypothetical protein DFH06DRAFT_1148707 [Mycena polygramma]|nr:hypothetical protein DFH06DRAFT_1148707 [Mycena polygramma]